MAVESAAFTRGYMDAARGRKFRDISKQPIAAELKVEWMLGWYQYFIEYPPFPNEPVYWSPDPNDPLAELWASENEF